MRMRAGLLELEVEDACHAGPAIQRKKRKKKRGALLGRCGRCLMGRLGVAKWPLRARMHGKGLRGGGGGGGGAGGGAPPGAGGRVYFFSFILFSISISCFFHNFFTIAPNELKPISNFFF
jgi:hypothetical protein